MPNAHGFIRAVESRAKGEHLNSANDADQHELTAEDLEEIDREFGIDLTRAVHQREQGREVPQ